MTEHFNYGPRMNFDQLHKCAHSTSIPSEYLDSKSGMNSQNTRPPRAPISSSSVASSLGSHWKRVNSVPMLNGEVRLPVDSSFSVPASRPPTAPSSFSSYSSASDSDSAPFLDSLNSVEHSSGNASVRASPASSYASSGTITHLSSSSDVEEQMPDSLTEKTDAREERQCLSLQKQGIFELCKALERTTKNQKKSERLMRQFFVEENERSKHFISKTRGFVAELSSKFDEVIGSLEKKKEAIHDQLAQILELFHTKAEIETFVRENEDVVEVNSKTLELLNDNERRVENIRKMLDFNRTEPTPLTVFEQEDARVADVFRSVVAMIRSLPLSENEKADMELAIEKTENNAQFDGKYKCETVIRHLLTIMTNWGEAGGHRSLISLSSDNWKSVDDLNSVSSSSGRTANEIESSSFALSDLQTDDSNLNDLDGQLRTARLKQADGPIEFESWPSASQFSRWSSASDARTEVQSLGEQMTLSSYEITSSDGQSTTSSVSTHSMPNQTFETHHNDSADLKTALSQGERVVAQPPRSGSFVEDTEVFGPASTLSHSVDSLSFSSVSDIVEDALHTAKEASETNASNLMEALHKSASKCGVAISDLMTAVSSSSESLSDTQTSHSITH